MLGVKTEWHINSTRLKLFTPVARSLLYVLFLFNFEQTDNVNINEIDFLWKNSSDSGRKVGISAP